MVLIKYSGKYVKIYFNMKITFFLSFKYILQDAFNLFRVIQKHV